jgi:hypothetical protein
MLDLPATSAMMVGNRGIEPRTRKGAGFTGPLSHQTWRYPEIGCGKGIQTPVLLVMSQTNCRGSIPRKIAEASNSSTAPAYIRPARSLVPAPNLEQGVTQSKLAESRELESHTVSRAIGIRSRAGAPVRLTLQLAESGDPASQRRTAHRLSKTRRASPGSLSNGGEVLVLIRGARAPSRIQNGADVPAGYPSVATTIEPTSSTFGRSRLSS